MQHNKHGVISMDWRSGDFRSLFLVKAVKSLFTTENHFVTVIMHGLNTTG